MSTLPTLATLGKVNTLCGLHVHGRWSMVTPTHLQHLALDFHLVPTLCAQDLPQVQLGKVGQLQLLTLLQTAETGPHIRTLTYVNIHTLQEYTAALISRVHVVAT